MDIRYALALACRFDPGLDAPEVELGYVTGALLIAVVATLELILLGLH